MLGRALVLSANRARRARQRLPLCDITPGGSRRNVVYAGAAATAATLGIVSAQAHDGQLSFEAPAALTWAQARVETVVRLVRLVSTVTAIVAEYKAHELRRMLGSAAESAARAEYDRLEEQMRQAQEAQRLAGMDEAKAKTAEERKEAQERGKRCRAEALVAAAALARAEERGECSASAQVHRSGAERLLALCRRNRGVYVKLGQHLAQLDYVLPKEYPEVLRCMLDQAPRTDYRDVREVVREELGAYPEEIWEAFDPEPIASASLAQVHRAWGKDGQPLAVKVQHRGLSETFRGDLDTACMAVQAVGALLPGFGSYQWLADEVQDTLPNELDFLHEARNSIRCAKMFEGRRDVCVPAVVEEQTTRRVLTMHFEEGLKATDVEGMRRQGIRLRKVASLISQVFCEQTFRHGFVHCDPHPANVLVRRMHHGGGGGGGGRGGEGYARAGAAGSRSRDWGWGLGWLLSWGRGGGCWWWRGGGRQGGGPGEEAGGGGAGGWGPPQLVLLDHGLYRTLGDDFRLGYCKLWKALALADVAGIEKHCQEMNAGEMYPLLAAMLTSRPWDDFVEASGGPGDALRAGSDAAAEARLLQGYVNQYMGDINIMLARVPRQMLLLFKTNDCLRHIDRSLGAPVNTFAVTAKTCLRVLHEEEAKQRLRSLMLEETDSEGIVAGDPRPHHPKGGGDTSTIPDGTSCAPAAAAAATATTLAGAAAAGRGNSTGTTAPPRLTQANDSDKLQVVGAAVAGPGRTGPGQTGPGRTGLGLARLRPRLLLRRAGAYLRLLRDAARVHASVLALEARELYAERKAAVAARARLRAAGRAQEARGGAAATAAGGGGGPKATNGPV